LANSPSNLARNDQFVVNRNCAPAVVSAAFFGIGAPLTVKPVPGSD
jgi:hypothetical protein